MLTTGSSQYLHPDYLQPLPTTLDAKKSPLALLAQTCSSIGKDTTPAKSIIPPIDKKEKDRDNRKSASPGGQQGAKSPAVEERKPRSSGSSHKDERASPACSVGSRDSPKSSFRAPVPKDIPPLVPITSTPSEKRAASSPLEGVSGGHLRSSSSSGGSGSGVGKSTSSALSSASSSSSSASERETTSVTSALPQSLSATRPSSSGAHSNSRISLSCGNMLLEVNHQEAASKSLHGLPPSHPALAGLSAKDGLSIPSALHHGLASSYPGLPMLGHHLPLESAMYHQALQSAHSGHMRGLSEAQKAAVSAHGSSALSPYVSYARVKTTSGATTLVPICKDPYCTHCQMTMHSAQLTSACAAGCTQCNHDKYPGVPTSLASAVSAASLSGFHFLPPGGASSLALSSSLYPHALGLLPGMSSHHHGPYVCNWMAGSDYCGKRFGTSEELLQHLRTHTSSAEMASALHPGLSPYASLAASSLSACHSHLSAPGSLSPNSLRQSGYPRSLSPSSLMAASRYHPYKSPLSSLPTPGMGGSSGLSSALSAYYSPYSLYGQRIGAAVVP